MSIKLKPGDVIDMDGCDKANHQRVREFVRSKGYPVSAVSGQCGSSH